MRRYDFVPLPHQGGFFRRRTHGRGDFDDGVTGVLDRRPGARSDPGQNRRAKRGAFFGLDDVDVVAVDVGLNLPPERRARAAAAQPNTGDRHAELGEDAKRILQAEGDALENRADDVTARVARGKPDERRTGLGVEVWRAFAHQVRRPERAFRARRHARRFFCQPLIRIASIVLAGAEAIAEPAERLAGRQSHTHHVPAARDGVAEGVEAPLRVERGPVGCGEDDTRGADGGADESRLDDTHPHRAGGLIAAACDHWRALAQAGCGGPVGADAPGDGRGFVRLRQKREVEVERGGDLRGPASVRDVEEERP